MSPVVGKAMEATLVVLYVGLVTATMYGGTVPEYRAVAGQEVAERTVAGAATEIEAAIPPEATDVSVRVGIELPSTIAGSAYRINATDGRLVLEHPDPAITTGVPLLLPDRVDTVSGTWSSGGRTTLVVENRGGLEVRLE